MNRLPSIGIPRSPQREGDDVSLELKVAPSDGICNVRIKTGVFPFTVIRQRCDHGKRSIGRCTALV